MTQSLDEIFDTREPSLTGDDAYMLVLDILCFEKTWRCYPRLAHPRLIHHFLNAHAKTLGLGKGEVLALAPVDTFVGYRPDGPFGGITFRGGVYLNGAVMRMTNEEGEHEDVLFVEQATAVLWNYPTQDYFYFAEHFPDATMTTAPRES